jgi:hypothetical protein
MEDIINEFFGAIGDFLSTPIVQLARSGSSAICSGAPRTPSSRISRRR